MGDLDTERNTQEYQEFYLSSDNYNDTKKLSTQEFLFSEMQTTLYTPYPQLNISFITKFQTVSVDCIQDQLTNTALQVQFIQNVDFGQFQFKNIESSTNDLVKGGYSKIDYVKDFMNRTLVRKNVTNRSAFFNELRFFQETRNNYIVNIHFYSKVQQQLYLEKGDYTIYSLFKLHRVKNQFFIFLLCLSLIEAVSSLHVSNLFHGDIKPQNVILFIKDGFDISSIENDLPIDIEEAKQCFGLTRFLDFEVEATEELGEIQLDLNENTIQYSELNKIFYQMQQNGNNVQLKYKSYTEMLLNNFKISIKFIDFQSSSHLNASQRISFFSGAFVNTKIFSRIKDKIITLNDKIYIDQYSTFRSLLLIAKNFKVDEHFVKQNDHQSILNIQNNNPLLKSFLTSFYSVIETLHNQYKQDNLDLQSVVVLNSNYQPTLKP